MRFSYEIFPPKSDAAREHLLDSLDDLATLAPSFISVTSGAGGSARDTTRGLVGDIAARTGLPVAAHLTCVGATRAEIAALAEQYWQSGVRHLLALRGDPPQGGDFVAHPGGYGSAASLVDGLARQAPFEISVAAYPEAHPQAASLEADIANLKRKLDAGAVRAITQFCFDTDRILRFRDLCAAAGISQEIVPGILPIGDFDQMRRFAARCGASVPDWLQALFARAPQPATRATLSALLAAEQIARLRAEGFTQCHIYTLNRANPAAALSALFTG